MFVKSFTHKRASLVLSFESINQPCYIAIRFAKFWNWIVFSLSYSQRIFQFTDELSACTFASIFSVNYYSTSFSSRFFSCCRVFKSLTAQQFEVSASSLSLSAFCKIISLSFDLSVRVLFISFALCNYFRKSVMTISFSLSFCSRFRSFLRTSTRLY